ncbi:uncharacterized protein LOC113367137 [Ctenocephalides felis]|uniref:uncharacterized protein LOC113367137 n=1 Tax=Ctenocephalides felis TaxID=7515 RepID=UPI000E6E4E8A|nr:uncharacterized protein LOC113367137 [Ctenocephalides felis]
MNITTKFIQDIRNLENTIALFIEKYATDKTILNDELQCSLQIFCKRILYFEKIWSRNLAGESNYLNCLDNANKIPLETFATANNNKNNDTQKSELSSSAGKLLEYRYSIQDLIELAPEHEKHACNENIKKLIQSSFNSGCIKLCDKASVQKPKVDVKLLPKKEILCTEVIQLYDKHHYCMLCYIFLNSKDIPNHIVSKNHIKRQKYRLSSIKAKKAYFCFICKTVSFDAELFAVHIQQTTHKHPQYIQKECFKCHIQFYGATDNIYEHKHFKSELEQEVESVLQINNDLNGPNDWSSDWITVRNVNFINRYAIYRANLFDNCLLCNVNICKGELNILTHIKGSKHEKGLKNDDKIDLIRPFLNRLDNYMKDDNDNILLSNRDFIFPYSKRTIYCKPCNKEIDVRQKKIFTHLKTMDHISQCESVIKSSSGKLTLLNKEVSLEKDHIGVMKVSSHDAFKNKQEIEGQNICVSFMKSNVPNNWNRIDSRIDPVEDNNIFIDDSVSAFIKCIESSWAIVKPMLISYFGCKNKGLFFKDLVCQECGLIIFSNDEGALPKHTPITFKFNDTSVNTDTKIDGKEIMFTAMNELHGNASHMNGGCLGVREDNFYDNGVLDTITKYYVNDGMDIGCVPAFSNEKIAVPLMNDFVEEYEHGQLDNLKIIENNGVEANNGNDTENVNVTNSKEETHKLEEIFLKFWDDFDLSDKNLSLNKQIFGIIDKGFLKCLLCRHKLTLNKRGVLGHINGMSHRRNLSEFLEIRHYCSVCRLFIQDFNLHKISSNHISNIPDYNDDFNKDNPPTMKHECSECRVISYYPAGTNFEHTHFEFEFSKVITKGKISSNAKIRKKILTLIEDEQVLNDYSVNLIKLAKTAAQSNELILATCTMLEKNLSVFTSCKAYPFGSRMTGLGCESSDLDIFFDSGSMYNGLQNQNSQFQNSLIDVCCEVLKKCDEWDFVFPVTKARTPIIKAFNTVYKMDCDISFRNGLGVENTVILK